MQLFLKPLIFLICCAAIAVCINACDCSIDPKDMIKADFTANKTQVCAGEIVTFNDQTTSAPTAWQWIFEGGTPETSDVQNPLVTYGEPGVYRVTLKAFKGELSNYVSKDTFITVVNCASSLLVDFTSDARSIHACDSVFYMDASDSGITAWQWAFEGGQPATSTDKNPIVVYSTPGNYRVTLQVSKGPQSNIKTVERYLTVVSAIPPVVSFTSNKTTANTFCDTVAFHASADIAVDSWNWTFEGGTPATSTEQNPKVLYKDAGKYKVTLTASTCGAAAQVVKTEYITAIAPVVDFSSDVTTVSSSCEEITFSPSSDVSITQWNWTFEGGTPATSTEQKPKVKYDVPGSYKVSLKVAGCGNPIEVVKEDYITVANRLIAHYKFDGNANDASGNNHHGTRSGAILVADRFGNANSAYSFDGVDDFIRVPDHQDLRLNGFSYSISVWVRINEPNNTWDNTVLSKRSDCNQNGWFFHVTDNAHTTSPPNTFVYNVSGCSDPQILSPSDVIKYGSWHNLILVYQADLRTLTMYIDGKVQGTAPNFPAPNQFESSDLFIGMDEYTRAFRDDFYFKGFMDDVRIYKKALSACEIERLQD